MPESRPGRPTVLITRRLPPEATAVIAGAAPAPEVRLWDSDDAIPRERLLHMASGVDGLLCLLTDRIDEEVLDSAGPGLKVISNMAVGYDNIDVASATRRGVVVTNTPDVLTETTADLTWALILAACRRVGEAIDHLTEERWRSWRIMELAGLDVYGRSLGIIGAGRIGRAVARRATGFSMDIIYHSRSPKTELERETGASYRASLHDLLGEADIVTLHVPLTPETRHLIGRRELELMKPTAVLVNTSRGPAVDEGALAEFLVCGRLRAAGLDVYNTEPLPASSPLRGLSNAILLPHIGSATVATRTAMAKLAAENLVAVIGGRPPRTPVNRPA